MRIVTMPEAEAQLSSLVDAVQRGEEDQIVIARDGKPVARRVSMEPKPSRVRLGLFDVPSTLERFNAMDDEIAGLFEKSEIFPKRIFSKGAQDNDPDSGGTL